jgi:shikimate kinase
MIQRIFLIGPMGTGKTTIGKQLAEVLHYNFIDSDQQIEEEQQLSITSIFKQYGEDFFRNQKDPLMVLRELMEIKFLQNA